jgi:hypothetical protein
MSIIFPNSIIQDYFSEIRKLLYLEDGRVDNPSKDLLDFNKVKLKDINYGLLDDPHANSKIEVIPPYSLLDNATRIPDDDNVEFSTPLYRESFLEIPYKLEEISQKTEIDYGFYEYSVLGKNDSDNYTLLSSIINNNYAMQRSDYLFMMIVTKFDNMVNRYQDCIKESQKHFHFNKKTKEDIILQHLIKYYSDIRKTKDKQLELFKSVILSKSIADLYAKILIEFLTLKLNTISPDIDKYYIVAPEDSEFVRKGNEKIIYELPENFSLTRMGINSRALNRQQTSVLFHYLRKYAITIDYSDTSYSKLVHYFSGFSQENIRQELSWVKLEDILINKKEEKDSDAKIIISLLEKIISEIKEEIK